MRPEDLPDILPEAVPDPALVASIAASLTHDLRPVRPLPRLGRTVSTLLVIFLAISVLGAAKLGFFGVQRLSWGAIALIFPALGGLAVLAAAASASAMVPGGRRPFHPAVLTAAGCGVLVLIFVLLFHDDSLGRFVPQGVACLKAGLFWAAPQGALSWLVLRRGFAVERGAAGVAAGTFAGLAGLAMLELHCPNFRLLHVVVWHVAVVPIAALAGWAFTFWGRSAGTRN
jgi:Negative regulator of sigma F